MKLRLLLCICLCMVFAVSAFAQTEAPPIEWTRQFGLSGYVTSVVVDTTGVYVAGYTAINTNYPEAFIRKYDSDGTELWSRQFGSTAADYAQSVAVDATGVYVAGYASGALPGQTNAGGYDAYIRKYDHTGTELWTQQFGTSGSDFSYGVGVDATGIYVVGMTSGAFPGQTNAGGYDAYIRKYDHAGTELWTQQFGTSINDAADGVAVDATSVYVVGGTAGMKYFGGSDAYIRKYDHAGTELWTQQFGTSDSDDLRGIAVDATGVYVAGCTAAALPGQTSAGSQDAYIRKYDLDGTGLWTHQFGTSGEDCAQRAAVDATGVYVAGATDRTLPGQTSNHGVYDDSFIRKYDLDGTELWTHQFGTSGSDAAGGVAADATGVYVAGFTPGDIYLLKFAPSGNTPAGTDVAIQLSGGTSTAGGAALTFSDVTASGNTTISESTIRPQPPTGYKLGNPQMYYELSTTAIYSGTITVCINYSNVGFKKESQLRLFHYVNGTPTDITVSLDMAAKIICGTVTSLSPFIIAEPENIPPVANIAPVGITVLGQATALNGSSSNDRNGTIVSYVWNLGDGNGTTGAVVGHAYAASGTYTATLTVTDDEGATGTASVAVTVNAPPAASIVPVQTAILHEPLTFNGSASHDADGTIASYAWNFGDGVHRHGNCRKPYLCRSRHVHGHSDSD
jgi:hypothetical protein